MPAQPGITQDDLFKEIVKLKYKIADSDCAIFVLQGALKLKTNAGVVIKNQIKLVY